jgi:hypothetical protein
VIRARKVQEGRYKGRQDPLQRADGQSSRCGICAASTRQGQSLLEKAMERLGLSARPTTGSSRSAARSPIWPVVRPSARSTCGGDPVPQPGPRGLGQLARQARNPGMVGTYPRSTIGTGYARS